MLVRDGHRFFLNPYEDAAFTKCPKCEGKTKVRKFPLVIHIDPSQLFLLNKQCRYCEGCDLIIARRSEVENLVVAAFEQGDRTIIGNEYVVVGTLPRKLWRACNNNTDMRPMDVLDRTHIFKDVSEFELIPGGWVPDETVQDRRKNVSKRKNSGVGRKSRKQTRQRAKTPRSTARSEIYELKITLLDTSPPIWRRFAVPGGITLAALHDVIQIVMGWEDCHPHQFTDENESQYRSDFLAEDDPEVIDGARVRLCDVVEGKGSQLLYEYDFGDDWEHKLEVLSIGPPKPGVKYPTCLASELACPPEDCGGPYRYYNLLEIIADPEHEEHEDRLDWLGDDFDPEAFDIEKVNRILAG